MFRSFHVVVRRIKGFRRQHAATLDCKTLTVAHTNLFVLGLVCKNICQFGKNGSFLIDVDWGSVTNWGNTNAHLLEMQTYVVIPLLSLFSHFPTSWLYCALYRKFHLCVKATCLGRIFDVPNRPYTKNVEPVGGAVLLRIVMYLSWRE